MSYAAGKFFWFLLFMVETLLYFTYYGVMCVAVTPNLLAAAVASNSLYLTMNLFSGFVIPAPVSLCLFFLFFFSFFSSSCSFSLQQKLCKTFAQSVPKLFSLPLLPVARVSFSDLLCP